MTDEAARIIVQSGQASISYLQRRLRIGFSRAARLVDMMEMEGLVSPAAGGKPREVLVDSVMNFAWLGLERLRAGERFST